MQRKIIGSSAPPSSKWIGFLSVSGIKNLLRNRPKATAETEFGNGLYLTAQKRAEIEAELTAVA